MAVALFVGPVFDIVTQNTLFPLVFARLTQ
jgi:hypothetical protein